MSPAPALNGEEARVHDLKVWPPYFDALIDGSKTFELRKDDRGFAVGDVLTLHEYEPGPDRYTGRGTTATVTYVLRGVFGVQPGFVVLGIDIPEVPALAARRPATEAEAAVERVRGVLDALASTADDAAADGVRPVVDARTVVRSIRAALGDPS